MACSESDKPVSEVRKKVVFIFVPTSQVKPFLSLKSGQKKRNVRISPRPRKLSSRSNTILARHRQTEVLMDKYTFKSSAEAFAALAEDANAKDRIKEDVEKFKLVDGLVRMRLQKGISQKKLSELMSCTPSKISRFEANSDDNLKFGEVKDYVKALNIGMAVIFENQDVPAAELIKQQVFAIHEKLERLVKIAEKVDGDEEIVGKIQRFYGEVLFNFFKKFQDSHSRLCMVLAPDEPSSSTFSTTSQKLLQACESELCV